MYLSAMSDTDLILKTIFPNKKFLSPVFSDGWVSLQLISVRKRDWLYKHTGNKVRNLLQFIAFFMTTVFWVIIQQNVSKQ